MDNLETLRLAESAAKDRFAELVAQYLAGHVSFERVQEAAVAADSIKARIDQARSI